MSLHSPLFLFGLLPIALVVLVPISVIARFRPHWTRARNISLLVASLLFYAPAGTLALLLLGGVGVFDFAASRTVPFLKGPWGRKLLVAGVAVAHVSVLVVFKAGSSGAEQPFSSAVIVPLGLSYLALRSLATVVDVWQGKTEPPQRLTDYLAFVFFFPVVVAGPLVRWREFGPELTRCSLSRRDAVAGVRRIIVGLSKKAVLCSQLEPVVGLVFDSEARGLSSGTAWLAVLAFSLQIYLDFSAYSDMAVGLSRLLGFSCPENFDHPYGAITFRDFWQRWHTSLSHWLRDYVFLPLAYMLGRRFDRLAWSPRRANASAYAVATLTTMTLCGLWHGRSAGFIVWGVLHACLLVGERLVWGRLLSRAPAVLRRAIVIGAVAAGWIVFRSPSLGIAQTLASTLFGLGSPGEPMARLVPLTTGVFLALASGIVASTGLGSSAWKTTEGLALASGSRLVSFGISVLQAVWFLALLVASMAFLASSTHRPFVYAGF